MSYAKITVIGHVGSKPEIKVLPSGMTVANLSVATNEKFQSKGEWVEKTQWFRIDAMQKGERGLVTEVIAKCVTAGTQVMVEGAPQQEEWVDKNGQKQRGFKIRIGHPGSHLELCGRASGNGASAKAIETAPVDAATGRPIDADLDKDTIPF